MKPVLSAYAGLAASALAAVGGVAAAQPPAAPPAYSPPPETSRLLDGPDLAQAQMHCMACHSADYVNTQPRGMPEAFWTAEVAKMRTAYGAPMTDDDAKAVVKYLTATYAASPTRSQ
jgi:mono/diheme cytochrome c family protein